MTTTTPETPAAHGIDSITPDGSELIVDCICGAELRVTAGGNEYAKAEAVIARHADVTGD
jgi:hypothetical protein